MHNALRLLLALAMAGQLLSQPLAATCRQDVVESLRRSAPEPNGSECASCGQACGGCLCCQCGEPRPQPPAPQPAPKTSKLADDATALLAVPCGVTSTGSTCGVVCSLAVAGTPIQAGPLQPIICVWTL